MKKKGKSGFTMKKMLLLFALVPLVVGGLIVTIFLVENAKKSIKEVTHNYMYSMAVSEGQGLYDEMEYYGAEEALSTESLTEYCSDLNIKDVSSSYCYVADANGTMLWHPTAEKIGEPVTNSTILGVTADMAAGKHDDPAVVDYEFKGAMKYASYYVAPDNSFVLVMSADESDVLSRVNAMTSYAIVIDIVVTVIFIVIAVILSKMVATPITQIAEEMQEFSEGDMNTDREIHSVVNETKMLITAYEKLQSQVKNIIGVTQGISNNLSDGAANVVELSEHASTGINQISSAMEDLANGATSMAESVQNINSSIITMGNSVDTIATNTESLVQSSNDIKDATIEANSYMRKVSDSSQNSVESVHKIASQINETSEAIKSIEIASNVISDIASQTNLLSLNASIEAARAGEAGRGFAVVASEIQKLAEQSNQSASDIKEIVQNITIQSDKTVELSSEIAGIISKEQEYIADTQEKFDLLSENIDNSITQIKEIADKVEELNSVKTTITSEVQDLSAISEENAASNEEVSASVINISESINTVHTNSDDTKKLTVDLNDTISYFK
jgi:methyl-accepting chemotaxis protein